MYFVPVLWPQIWTHLSPQGLLIIRELNIIDEEMYNKLLAQNQYPTTCNSLRRTNSLHYFPDPWIYSIYDTEYCSWVTSPVNGCIVLDQHDTVIGIYEHSSKKYPLLRKLSCAQAIEMACAGLAYKYI